MSNFLLPILEDESISKYTNKTGKLKQPKSILNRKGPFKFINTISRKINKSTISLNQDELSIFYRYVEYSKIRFDQENIDHLNALNRLYESVFNKKSDNCLNDKEWERIGFQVPTPQTDFRSGGLLSLFAIIDFADKKKLLLQDTIEFFNKYENFFLACTVISATLFLKTYLHFGVYDTYSNKIHKKKVSSQKAIKFFFNFGNDTFEQSLSIFFKLVSVYTEKLFSFWKKNCIANEKITILDFNTAENSYKDHFIELFETAAEKANKTVTQDIDSFCDDFKNTELVIKIKPFI